MNGSIQTKNGKLYAVLSYKGENGAYKALEEAKAAGGLKIIGTERHESRRIDNQLRGRSGRQGDPGESRFYISLEDDLMRIFGGEKVISIMNMLNVEDDMAIENPIISRQIQSAIAKSTKCSQSLYKNPPIKESPAPVVSTTCLQDAGSFEIFPSFKRSQYAEK